MEACCFHNFKERKEIMMNKKILALLLGACLIFALAGCSVSHSSSSTSTVSSTVNGETTTTTTETTTTETTTAEPSLCDKIKDKVGGLFGGSKDEPAKKAEPTTAASKTAQTGDRSAVAAIAALALLGGAAIVVTKKH